MYSATSFFNQLCICRNSSLKEHARPCPNTPEQNGGPPSLNWGKSFLRKKMYWGFSYLNGVSKKTVQKRRTCPCWRRKNPKIQLIAESEGAIALFCQKELSLYEIKELLISIHLLRWLETVFCILRLWTRCDFSDRNCTVLNEVTLFSTFHCA